MRHCSNLTTTSEALRRVFLSAFQASLGPSLYTIRKTRPSPPQCLHRPTPSPFRPHQRRHASTSRMGGYQVHDPDSRSGRPRPDRFPRDEEIKAFKIYMVRSEDQRLTEPLFTTDILNSRERDEKGRTTQFLQEVAPANIEEGRYHPVCKMVDKKEAREAAVAKRKSGKEKKIQMKQLEISWIVAENDLKHRLGRMKEYLGKGWRVEIIFGAKRKGWMDRREATREEVVNVLETIRGAVRDVEGAKEWREMQGTEGGDAVLSFEGKSKKQVNFL